MTRKTKIVQVSKWNELPNPNRNLSPYNIESSVTTRVIPRRPSLTPIFYLKAISFIP